MSEHDSRQKQATALKKMRQNCLLLLISECDSKVHSEKRIQQNFFRK